MGSLEGRVAVISGAARGQGRSHALYLAGQGADIVALDICADIASMDYPNATPEDLSETARQVEALDRRILTYQVDVRDAAAVKKSVDEAFAEFGRIDIVLPQAGIVRYDPTTTYEDTVALWDDIMGVNISGYFHLIEACLPHLIAGGRGGSIVMTGSTAATRPPAGHGGSRAYVAAKYGVVGLMKTYALSLAQHWIRVNVVHPTGVRSGMTMNPAMAKLAEQAASGEDNWIAQSRNLLDVDIVEPQDITAAIAFLVSDQARYITGEEIKVDAGFSLL